MRNGFFSIGTAAISGDASMTAGGLRMLDDPPCQRRGAVQVLYRLRSVPMIAVPSAPAEKPRRDATFSIVIPKNTGVIRRRTERQWRQFCLPIDPPVKIQAGFRSNSAASRASALFQTQIPAAMPSSERAVGRRARVTRDRGENA